MSLSEKQKAARAAPHRTYHRAEAMGHRGAPARRQNESGADRPAPLLMFVSQTSVPLA